MDIEAEVVTISKEDVGALEAVLEDEAPAKPICFKVENVVVEGGKTFYGKKQQTETLEAAREAVLEAAAESRIYACTADAETLIEVYRKGERS